MVSILYNYYYNYGISYLFCRWFSALIYGVFLFVVTVILLNLLIAQFSKSYEEVNERARVSVALDRAKVLTRLQSSLWIQSYVRPQL